jgi:hypothetical protein
MSKKYITNVRKVEGTSDVSEITDYKYYESDGEEKIYHTATKKYFCENLYTHGHVFSENPEGERAECEMNESINGEKYLQTKGNTTTKDNLLSLPKF